jgi:hypothetical protein
MTTEVEHTDVAAYALGLLEESDRGAFEVHLAHCGPCVGELSDFTVMADLFGDVPPIETVSAEEEDIAGGQLIDMLRHRKVAERSRRRGTAILGAAAGVVLLAGGAVAGGFAAGDDPAHPLPSAMPGHAAALDEIFKVGEKVAGTNATNGVTGMIAMQSKGWGTDVGMELSHVKGPLVCKLVAVSKTGKRRTVTEWSVPPKGYGLPGSPMKSLQVHGGTAISRADLARFDVQIEGSGRTLLSIPV